MGEGEVLLRRELNLREAQISSLERELAKLKAQSRTSRASTLFEEDDPRPQPKYEKPGGHVTMAAHVGIWRSFPTHPATCHELNPLPLDHLTGD